MTIEAAQHRVRVAVGCAKSDPDDVEIVGGDGANRSPVVVVVAGGDISLV